MGNLFGSLKRFLSNKNTVTILGVIIGVLVLWFFYNYRVNDAISPVMVPYAKVAISATEEITADMIGQIEVNGKFLRNKDVITSPNLLVGKYVTTGTSIPKDGLFHQSQVVEKSQLPNTVFDTIPKGYTLFSLGVNNHSTFGNSIYPGDRIDLYIKATDEQGKIMFGKFIESIEVAGVKDSAGKNVFDSPTATNPAELLFPVPDELYTLLMKSKFISGLDIIPVPRNKQYTSEAGDTDVSSEYLKSFILSKATEIDY
jgi:hypothetical protein